VTAVEVVVKVDVADDVIVEVIVEVIVGGVEVLVCAQPLNISPAKIITAKTTEMIFFTATSTPF
jgi:hypothetical protein